MRIVYVTHTRFPTEKAHGYQVAQVCSALSQLGHQVTLLAPTIRNAIRQDAASYYGMPPTFDVIHLPNFDAWASRLVPGPLGFAVGMWSYRRQLRKYFAEHSADLLYVRSPAVLGALLQTGIPVLLELHTLPSAHRAKFLRQCRACRLVICLTTQMKSELVSWGMDERRIIVEGDGVDLERFHSMGSREESKHRWQLPADRPTLGYVGTLVTQDTIEKGVRMIVEAAAELKTQGKSVYTWIVGGPASWQEHYRLLAESMGLTPNDIRFTERVMPSDVPSVLSACDACLYPAPKSDHPFFRRDTSPLKLFEYLAAERPIVAADLPPLRDVLNESVVRFVPPGDGQAMAREILWLLEHPDQAQAMAEAGFALVQKYTWKERMERILGRT